MGSSVAAGGPLARAALNGGSRTCIVRIRSAVAPSAWTALSRRRGRESIGRARTGSLAEPSPRSGAGPALRVPSGAAGGNAAQRTGKGRSPSPPDGDALSGRS
ncbi:hypothetical protein AwMethylo_36940 [Methylobacterium sp.]|nr:hypothetical protein AwMethylo_36940 [Methylobacterium sp.]